MTDQIDVFVGNHIRDLRIKMGVQRRDLAKNLGISINELENYEEGNEQFKASILYGIANYLGLPIGNLLPDDPPRGSMCPTLH